MEPGLRTILSTLTLFVLWLLMSGLWSKSLIITLGLISSLFAVLMVRRMDAADGYRLTTAVRPFEVLRYVGWLLVEIAKANWAVAKVIVTPQMKLRQHLFFVPYTQKSDLGQVTFANSITLTPGTITVETEEDQFLVHALDFHDDVPGELAEMDRRVGLAESAGAG